MNSLVTLLVIICGSWGLELSQNEWDLYKGKYGKSYDNKIEDGFRMKIYLENRHNILHHNKDSNKSGFLMGINAYGDRLNSEYIEELHNFNSSLGKNMLKDFINYISPYNIKVPEHVDWRDHGAVTKQKWDGACGASWAFSATGSLEGQQFRKTGKLISLSKQNLVDCSFRYGNKGCKGGNVENSFLYMKDNHGIDTEEFYPTDWNSEHAGICRYDKVYAAAQVKGFVKLPAGNEDVLKEAVATVGPISVAIDASRESFEFYQQGVYFEKECSKTDLNYAALVVGYGTESGLEYWLVKTSLSAFWGDLGYIKMARNRNNNCGIATSASFPLV